VPHPTIDSPIAFLYTRALAQTAHFNEATMGSHLSSIPSNPVTHT
jgi:hypothetical protein